MFTVCFLKYESVQGKGGWEHIGRFLVVLLVLRRSLPAETLKRSVLEERKFHW